MFAVRLFVVSQCVASTLAFAGPAFGQAAVALDAPKSRPWLRRDFLDRAATRDLDSEERTGTRPSARRAGGRYDAAFFEMQRHLADKTAELGLTPVRLREGTAYYDAIQPLCPTEVDLAGVTFYFGAYVPSGMPAIALGNVVYVDLPFSPSDRALLKVLAHETAHVLQYRRLRAEAFAGRYAELAFGERGRRSDFDPASHEASGLERDAADFACEAIARYDRRRNQVCEDAAVEIVPSHLCSASMSSDPGAVRPVLGINGVSLPGRGYRVAHVAPGSLAARAGLEVGDVVISIDGVLVESAAQIAERLANLARSGRRRATLTVEDVRCSHLPRERRLTELSADF